MALRTRRGIGPLQIPQFANINQISGSNLNSYIGATAGTPMEAVARSALQIPGGRMLDDELKAIESTLNDPSKRQRVQSPYASRLTALQSEARQVRDSVITDIQGVLQGLYQGALQEERSTSGKFGKDKARNRADALRGLINKVPSFGGNLSQSDTRAISQFLQTGEQSNYTPYRFGDPYQSRLSRLETLFPELDSIGRAEQQFQQTANAGISGSLTSAQRAELERRRAGLSNDAAARLRQAAQQFNREQQQGAIAASSIRISPQRPLTGRFGTPQTGVGIAARGAL